MTRRLSGVKVRRVERALRRLGYELQVGRGKGSHQVYWHPITNGYTTLSHKDGTVPAGTLKSIARDVGLTTDAFLDLL